MSGLEAFGLIILTMLLYITCTTVFAVMVTFGDGDFPWVAWITGMLMFMAAVALWASGRPFPIGGGV